MTTNSSAADLVAAAKASIQNLDPEQFAKEVDEPGAVLVDLREPAELVDTGVIPGAIHIPRGMLEFRADPTSPYSDERLHPERRVLLYCASGGRSALAAATLAQMGYDNVAHLAGGFKSWTEDGRPTQPAG